MKQSDKNNFFEYFRENHDVLLTSSEIDAIIEIVEKSNQKHYLKFIQDKINKYRFINAVILGVLSFIPEIGLRAVFWLFISYNLIHILVNYIKRKYEQRES